MNSGPLVYAPTRLTRIKSLQIPLVTGLHAWLMIRLMISNSHRPLAIAVGLDVLAIVVSLFAGLIAWTLFFYMNTTVEVFKNAIRVRSPIRKWSIRWTRVIEIRPGTAAAELRCADGLVLTVPTRYAEKPNELVKVMQAHHARAIAAENS